MSRKFEKALPELPELRKAQNAVNHYRRTKMGGNDRYSELAARVVAAVFTGREGDHDAFTFSRNTDSSGKPIVGDGSDAHPFVVGVTTKALLQTADRDPAAFILHVDATFQLDQAIYPVFVCGISDGARKFHLLALFITSQLEESHYAKALIALQSVYDQVLGKRFNVNFVMGEADKAHVQWVANVRQALKERTRQLHGELAAEVYRGLYNLHFATGETEYLILKERVLFEWSKHPELDHFRAHMQKQWLEGHFSCWQAFVTPPGFATTNNPCEIFNRAFKRDYTQKRKLELAVLLQQKLLCCSHRSMAPVEFEHNRTKDTRLLARSTALHRGGFLLEHTYSRSSISFLVDGSTTDIVCVLAKPPQRFYVPSRGRSEEPLDVAAQFSVNYARMAIEDQPCTGWPVDVKAGHCPCHYDAKMNDCVHVLFAQHLRNHVDGDG